ncbi:MAG: hypothetical protein J7K37_05060 [Candidatus Omnitrophica bacterium]|nr:hypothetical protein [Candidatus Omnitrophota bacterium]
MRKGMEEKRRLMIFYLLFLLSFNIGGQLVYAENLSNVIGSIKEYIPRGSYDEGKGRYGEFNKGDIFYAKVYTPESGYKESKIEARECADYVKLVARPDLEMLGMVGNAKKLLERAKDPKDGGFEVNLIPREGAVLILPDLTEDGHAAVVHKIEKFDPKRGIYILTIRDAHVHKDNRLDERTIEYDINTHKVKDPALGSYYKAEFIHEKKEIFKARVASLIKNISGVEPKESEIKRYTDKIGKGEILTTEKLAVSFFGEKITNQQALEFPKILSQQQLQKIPRGQISSELEKQLIGGEIYSDSAKQKLASPHQLVTPVKVSFTQTFKGFFTQIPDDLASTADVSVNITEGTRTGVGSRPGDFTGSYTARAIAEPGWVCVEHHNTPFEGATATGTVEAKGFKEGPLKGSMTVNWESSAERITLTSNEVTIGTDGSLTANNLNGSVIDKSSGATEGTWTNGSLTQTPK